MGRNKALARQRKLARAEAAKALQTMSEADLTNMEHEIRREMAQRLGCLNEARMRHSMIKGERERRRSTGTAEGVTIGISDHAIVRYLERYKGFDVAAVRNEIVALAMRAGRLDKHKSRHKDEETGVVIAIDQGNNMVTTVLGLEEEAIMSFPGSAA